MRRYETPKTNRPPAVVPPIRHKAPWRVVSVQVLVGHRLKVTFVDETKGEVEMGRFLADSRLDDTPFEPLRDPEMFKRVEVVLGAVHWPSGADLAPDAMYDAIRDKGRWVLEF